MKRSRGDFLWTYTSELLWIICLENTEEDGPSKVTTTSRRVGSPVLMEYDFREIFARNDALRRIRRRYKSIEMVKKTAEYSRIVHG